jgi:hypothetical protein
MDITPFFQKAVVEVARSKGLTDVSLGLYVSKIPSETILTIHSECRMILKSFDRRKYCGPWVQKLHSRKQQRELYVITGSFHYRQTNSVN